LQYQGILKELLLAKSNVGKIVIIAIFVGFGISLTATSVGKLFEPEPFTGVIIGIIIAGFSIFFLIALILSNQERIQHVRGMFIYDAKQNKTVPIDRYQFSEYLERNLQSAFAENPDLKKIWEQESLDYGFTLVDDDALVKKKKGSIELIREALEYFVLSRLSITLTDYFNQEQFDDKHLQKIKREDVPQLLNHNRFLELFSKPMEERPHFVKSREDEEHVSDEKIVWAGGEGGIQFESFSLILPKGSNVTKIDKNRILIDTKKMSIEIESRFDEIGTVLPRGFEKYYVQIENIFDAKKGFGYHVSSIDVTVRIIFKIGILFTGERTKYYEWVDKFLEYLDLNISKDRFFEKIRWDTTYAVIKYLENFQNQKYVEKPNGKKNQ